MDLIICTLGLPEDEEGNKKDERFVRRLCFEIMEIEEPEG